MIEIPGRRMLCLEHLVCDYNGTLALDGDLLPGVRESLVALAMRVQVHVIIADTFWLAKDRLTGSPVSVAIELPAVPIDS